MKRRFLAIALCCSMLFSAFGTTASAHTTLSGIGHSPSETHWDIFEEGYEIDTNSPFPYHSSGNGIMIKASYDILNTSCFSNIDKRIEHAVSAWSNAVFNGQEIFNGKIKK